MSGNMGELREGGITCEQEHMRMQWLNLWHGEQEPTVCKKLSLCACVSFKIQQALLGMNKRVWLGCGFGGLPQKAEVSGTCQKSWVWRHASRCTCSFISFQWAPKHWVLAYLLAMGLSCSICPLRQGCVLGHQRTRTLFPHIDEERHRQPKLGACAMCWTPGWGMLVTRHSDLNYYKEPKTSEGPPNLLASLLWDWSTPNTAKLDKTSIPLTFIQKASSMATVARTNSREAGGSSADHGAVNLIRATPLTTPLPAPALFSALWHRQGPFLAPLLLLVCFATGLKHGAPPGAIPKPPFPATPHTGLKLLVASPVCCFIRHGDRTVVPVPAVPAAKAPAKAPSPFELCRRLEFARGSPVADFVRSWRNKLVSPVFTASSTPAPLWWGDNSMRAGEGRVRRGGRTQRVQGVFDRTWNIASSFHMAPSCIPCKHASSGRQQGVGGWGTGCLRGGETAACATSAERASQPACQDRFLKPRGQWL